MADLSSIRSPRTPRTDHCPTIGIIGGGQLAKMLGSAASALGCHTVVLSEMADCPASATANRVITGSADDLAALRQLAESSDLVTLENEFVNAELLAVLEADGHLVLPTARSMHLVQDKFRQKSTVAAAGLEVPAFRDTPTLESLHAAADALGLPLVVKKRRNGYDGKGNFTARTKADLATAWQFLNGGTNALYAEAWFPFERELAVMITRSRGGECVRYPVVETIQKDHICHVVKAPAQISASLAVRVEILAEAAVKAMEGVGTFGVELFLTADGRVAVNELAPRVHNSGHYTIEACHCSQFENHIRAILGWPCGSPAMRLPAAVMINLLGAGKGSGEPVGLQNALAVPGAHPHIYSKARSAPSRKMGHLTALGSNLDEAFATASKAAAAIRFGD